MSYHLALAPAARTHLNHGAGRESDLRSGVRVAPVRQCARGVYVWQDSQGRKYGKTARDKLVAPRPRLHYRLLTLCPAQTHAHARAHRLASQGARARRVWRCLEVSGGATIVAHVAAHAAARVCVHVWVARWRAPAAELRVHPRARALDHTRMHTPWQHTHAHSCAHKHAPCHIDSIVDVPVSLLEKLHSLLLRGARRPTMQQT